MKFVLENRLVVLLVVKLIFEVAALKLKLVLLFDAELFLLDG